MLNTSDSNNRLHDTISPHPGGFPIFEPGGIPFLLLLLLTLPRRCLLLLLLLLMLPRLRGETPGGDEEEGKTPIPPTPTIIITIAPGALYQGA